MPKIIISNDTSDQVTILENHTDVVLKEGYNLAVADTFAIYNDKYSDTHMTINGQIDVLSMQSYAAISTYGTDNVIEIGKTGTINAPRGIQLNGDNETVINRGTINGADFGIRGGEGESHIINFGKINSPQGYALVLDDGADTVVNKGKINGSLETGDGDDRIDLRGGRVNGGVFGGDGNDVYTLGKDSAASLFDSSGDDILRTTVSYTADPTQGIEAFQAIGHKNINLTGDGKSNTLGGNAGNNHLSGRSGHDILDGGAGHDILKGGADSDHFYFHKGDDKDVIMDFDTAGPDHDMIYLTHVKSMDSFADIKSHMSLDHGDTVIDLGHGDRLTIRDVKPGELSAEDFNLNGFDL